ncbi:chromosome partitioning protein ParA [Vibrio parahaemolyticus]|uniref:chromosome partitioning protein ParA n=1 Tax=Vibrio parahaemolyticus TaxID=670 RepID=UPI001C7C9168|nr:chromosome partitioning protein ParA [Vibrio parahaemolyticus]EHZ2723076.1 chromosome partitioning protein ParA [Vibrio parahaemolyticus]EIO4604127.1 chromosome partitioning protein ParA [Vibrio parahaemolyticus]EIV1595805.1 chromosome partitioning protein ParA [Vibrio parahaemolyticus]MCX8904542.1 chromosome partitioning protein ParA [Vibrio parahaemolyticus]HBI3714433.1 chromosome partitioning protein ParA [Vibrio parahaemolyticus]
MNLSLKEELNDAIREIVSNTKRENKDKLRSLIEKTDYSLEELQVVVPSLLPPFSNTSKLTLSSHARFCNCILKSIYAKNNADSFNDDVVTESLRILDAVKNGLKEERKETKDLYNIALKTHITAEQHERFIANKKSYNYRSNAAFLRDVALNQVEPRPNNDEAYSNYFKETKELSKALQVLAEDLEDADSAEIAELSRGIKELEKIVNIIRKLAIDSHSSATAKILALKYLSSRQLDEICKQKILEEAEL